MVAFLEGSGGDDAEALDRALKDRQALMIPVVLTELLSDPKLPSGVAKTLSGVPLIDIGPGYSRRAAALRAKVLAKRREARLGETLTEVSSSSREIGIYWRSPMLRVSIVHLDTEPTDPTPDSSDSNGNPIIIGANLSRRKATPHDQQTGRVPADARRSPCRS